MKKTVILNDSELKELGGLLNSAISECLDDSLVCPFEDEKKKAKEQVHDIETIFHKHIEENFKGIKASHGTEEKKEK